MALQNKESDLPFELQAKISEQVERRHHCPTKLNKTCD
jgi:hypothetical protein